MEAEGLLSSRLLSGRFGSEWERSRKPKFYQAGHFFDDSVRLRNASLSRRPRPEVEKFRLWLNLRKIIIMFFECEWIFVLTPSERCGWWWFLLSTSSKINIWRTKQSEFLISISWPYWWLNKETNFNREFSTETKPAVKKKTREDEAGIEAALSSMIVQKESGEWNEITS